MNDTVNLLKECDSGIKMGIDAIDNVLDSVRSEEFRTRLTECRREHHLLKEESEKLLDCFGSSGKPPSPIADKMVKIKTKFELSLEPNDENIADMITDGCNMGVKSLNRYLNLYKSANDESKDITKRLIASEEILAKDIRRFL